MKTRIITAIVGLAVLAVVLAFFDTILFDLVLAAICLLGIHEVFTAMGFGKKQLDAALHRCQPLEPGRMQDIANTALFFASNMSANITGQTLLSDGGTSIKAHDMDC